MDDVATVCEGQVYPVRHFSRLSYLLPNESLDGLGGGCFIRICNKTDLIADSLEQLLHSGGIEDLRRLRNLHDVLELMAEDRNLFIAFEPGVDERVKHSGRAATRHDSRFAAPPSCVRPDEYVDEHIGRFDRLGQPTHGE
jgi:hypothetical protein